MNYFLINTILIILWYFFSKKYQKDKLLAFLSACSFYLGGIIIGALFLGLNSKNLTFSNLLNYQFYYIIAAFILSWFLRFFYPYVEDVIYYLGNFLKNILFFIIKKPTSKYVFKKNIGQDIKINLLKGGIFKSIFGKIKEKFSINYLLYQWQKFKQLLFEKLPRWELFFFIVLFLNPIFLLFLWQIYFTLHTGMLLPNAAYDTVDYHGPMVAFMFQNAQIGFDFSGSAYVNFYPKTVQIFFLWNFFFFKDSHILNISQFPFFLIGMLSIYVILRQMDISKFSSFLSSTLFLFFPVVIKQLSTAYIDIAVASLFLLSIALSLSLFQKGTIVLAIALGIALGLLGGTKSTALIYFFTILGLFLSLYFIPRRLRTDHSKITHPIIVVLICIPLGSVWLWQNYQKTGNPFYPIKAQFNRWEIFETKKEYQSHEIEIDSIYGYKQTDKFSNWEKLKISILESMVGVNKKFTGYDNSSLFGGGGPLFLIILLPSILLGLLFFRDNHFYYRLIFITVVILFILLFQPLAFRLRFIIGLFGLGLVFFGVIYDKLFVPFKIAVYIFILALCMYVSYVSNLDSQTPLRGRSINTPRIIAGFEKLPDRKRNGDKLFKFGYTNHPATKLIAKWIFKKKVRNKTIFVNKHYRYPALYLWNRDFSNRIYYYLPKKKKIKKLMKKYKPDFVLGWFADLKHFKKVKTKKISDLPDNAGIFKIKY
jgi:hypothetical protein